MKDHKIVVFLILKKGICKANEYFFWYINSIYWNNAGCSMCVFYEKNARKISATCNYMICSRCNGCCFNLEPSDSGH